MRSFYNFNYYIFRTYSSTNSSTNNPLNRFINNTLPGISSETIINASNTVNITIMETLVDNAIKMIEITQKKIPDCNITIEINQGLMKTIINKK